MKSQLRILNSVSLIGLVTAVALLSGCAVNMKVPVRDPLVSVNQYVKSSTAAPVALYFQDGRSGENKAALLTGKIPMQLVTTDGKPFDPFPWLVAQTVREMVARGLPVQVSNNASGPDVVVIKHFHVEDRRVSGFSPFETFISASADVVTPSSTERIATFIKRGKVPVWSFDEVIEPTYNQPLELTAKELAAKLGRILFDAKLDDAHVDALIAKTSDSRVDYHDVYELGFSNNPRAIPQLVILTSDKRDEVHQAALSALGILRDAQHFDLLKAAAENPKVDWEDRAAALKAIGDLGTPESNAYLVQARTRLDNLTDAGSIRTKELIGLYLN